MKQYSATEAALELGTDPKVLRRFLRQDTTYRNAGAGGRYSFSTSDMPKLKERFNAWNEPKKTRTARAKAASGDKGLAWSVAMTDAAAVRRLTEERVNRLENALREKGLHISQMPVSDWRARRAEIATDA